jgi:hypothetical protein
MARCVRSNRARAGQISENKGDIDWLDLTDKENEAFKYTTWGVAFCQVVFFRDSWKEYYEIPSVQCRAGPLSWHVSVRALFNHQAYQIISFNNNAGGSELTKYSLTEAPISMPMQCAVYPCSWAGGSRSLFKNKALALQITVLAKSNNANTGTNLICINWYCDIHL